MGAFVPSPKGQFIITQQQRSATHATHHTVRAVEYERAPHARINTTGDAAHPGLDVMVISIGKNAQPLSTTHKANTGSLPPVAGSPLLSRQVAPDVIATLKGFAQQRSPIRAGMAHLSLMKDFQLAARADTKFTRTIGSLVDWTLFSAGLVLGIVLLPFLYPIFRCHSAYREVHELRAGVADLERAYAVAKEIKDHTHLSENDAGQYLYRLRDELCLPKRIDTVFKTAWGKVADREVRRLIDSRISGFLAATTANDDVRNKAVQLQNCGNVPAAVGFQALQIMPNDDSPLVRDAANRHFFTTLVGA